MSKYKKRQYKRKYIKINGEDNSVFQIILLFIAFDAITDFFISIINLSYLTFII
jgi:hypothetical protein